MAFNIHRSSFIVLFLCLLPASTPLWGQATPKLNSPTSPTRDVHGNAPEAAPQVTGQPPVGVPQAVPLPPVAELSARGAADARVTIIEFSDFECSFCARVAPYLDELLKAYPNQLRFIFKHNPLPLHPHAPLAHEAALAAGAQGRFWEMHDLLFANQGRLNSDDLLGYAKQLNLELGAFRQALESHIYRPVVEQNLAEARGLGVSSTPTFFIDGTKLVGAQSLDAFKRLIDQRLGIRRESRKEVNIDRSPVRGSPKAPVTIVEFSDFQCPFCARALSTLQSLFQEYPDRVKLVFKNFPLDFHQDSLLAHQAALAAREQGKFWEMHDRIFANQRDIKRDDLVQMAKELGLDMARFLSDLDNGRFKGEVDADRAEGARLGVDGTPTFFINGQELVGAASPAEFKRIVDAELQAAGLKPAPLPTKAESASAGTGASKGPSEAPVTMVWYSDLESPLSPNAAQLIQEIINAFPEKVRVVFKNRPLEFHSEAVQAHEAALAAGAQGKFWEMHDLILANQKALSKADLLAYAARLGLDRKKFAAALDGHTYRPKVDDDLAEAKRLQVFGVPAFFVSGKRVDGIQPLSVFKEIIEVQLKQVVAQNR